MSSPVLHIVVYHYIRDLPRTRFPRIKGMLTQDFREQVRELAGSFEMATVESAVAFLQGSYAPSGDLCLLTFDDGLKEHYTEATPILAEFGIRGVFFLITRCLQEQRVAPVHMNHFLMADLPFDTYRSAFLKELRRSVETVEFEAAKRAYPWDTTEVAQFKYLFNFILQPSERDDAVRTLFRRYLGDEQAFSNDLYLNWAEARDMQSAGMAIGGHTHEHRPLSTLSSVELVKDLTDCRNLLDANLDSSGGWPFCYPYGKNSTFTDETVGVLQQLGFQCAFTTESGANTPGVDLFRVRRVDCKNAPAGRVTGVSA
jgi:peptidoglycan/xylan/chitin deacetylase (PgdA/CDA1 family)